MKELSTINSHVTLSGGWYKMKHTTKAIYGVYKYNTDILMKLRPRLIDKDQVFVTPGLPQVFLQIPECELPYLFNYTLGVNHYATSSGGFSFYKDDELIMEFGFPVTKGLCCVCAKRPNSCICDWYKIDVFDSITQKVILPRIMRDLANEDIKKAFNNNNSPDNYAINPVFVDIRRDLNRYYLTSVDLVPANSMIVWGTNRVYDQSPFVSSLNSFDLYITAYFKIARQCISVDNGGDSILPSSSIQAAISRTSNSSKISHYKQGVLQKESILPKDLPSQAELPTRVTVHNNESRISVVDESSTVPKLQPSGGTVSENIDQEIEKTIEGLPFIKDLGPKPNESDKVAHSRWRALYEHAKLSCIKLYNYVRTIRAGRDASQKGLDRNTLYTFMKAKSFDKNILFRTKLKILDYLHKKFDVQPDYDDLNVTDIDGNSYIIVQGGMKLRTEEEHLRQKIFKNHTLVGRIAQFVFEFCVGAENVESILGSDDSNLGKFISVSKVLIFKVLKSILKNPELLGISVTLFIAIMNYKSLLEHAKAYYEYRTLPETVQPLNTVFPVEGFLGALSNHSIGVMFGALALTASWKRVLSSKTKEGDDFFSILNCGVITTGVLLAGTSAFLEAVNLTAYSQVACAKRFYKPGLPGNVKIAHFKPHAEKQSHGKRILNKCHQCNTKYTDTTLVECPSCKCRLKKKCECGIEFRPAMKNHVLCDSCFVKSKPSLSKQEEQIKSTNYPKEPKLENPLTQINKVNQAIKDNEKKAGQQNKKKRKRNRKGNKKTSHSKDHQDLPTGGNEKQYIQYDNTEAIEDDRYEGMEEEDRRKYYEEHYFEEPYAGNQRDPHYEQFLYDKMIEDYGSEQEFIMVHGDDLHPYYFNYLDDATMENRILDLLYHAAELNGYRDEWINDYKYDYHDKYDKYEKEYEKMEKEQYNKWKSGKIKGGRTNKDKNNWINYADYEDIVLNQSEGYIGSGRKVHHSKTKAVVAVSFARYRHRNDPVKKVKVVTPRTKRAMSAIKTITSNKKANGKESHSKVPVDLSGNIIGVCNADGFIVGNAVLISKNYALGLKHYQGVDHVAQTIKGTKMTISPIADKIVLEGPDFDKLVLYRLSNDLVFKTLRAKVHSGTCDAMIFGGDKFKHIQISSVELRDGFLRWNGDSVRGDCGAAILDRDGNLIGIHAGADKSNRVAKGLFGLPILSTHLEKFRSLSVF